jgi:alpha-D-xyloside xylohydrolase
MSSEFMLGKSLLVCPVMRPMEYGPCGQKLDGSHRFKCYLPSGSDWIPAADEDGTVLAGGQEVEMEAGLQTIPYFVKAGSIVPMEEALTYAQEAADTPLLINIFPSRDASFAYYEDDGDGYAYRDGRYNRIEMKWNDAERLFAIGSAACHFPGGITGRRCRLLCAGQTKEFIYTGKEMSISF